MDSDQTARMRRLVWIHAGRKPFVGFVVTRLNYFDKKFQPSFVLLLSMFLIHTENCNE
jgi:hypothetical protein